jgi:aspartyl-tRNA(Asn)/glutamyl-tRNA(Gln) amidotransferase subunit B
MYTPTIGLEIHAELKTQTKMFCSCLNDPDESHPNRNVCPICLGHPGTLPTINKEAVLSVIRLGLALGGKVATNSHFDRKSYFYPDLPKGYQISQYEKPLVEGGILKGVRIRRVHLEEDTGRLLHLTTDDGQLTDGKMSNVKGQRSDVSFVDFNRAGVPLMELVTEPDIKTAEEAVIFAKELQRILRYLGISNADMEKGEMRVEANVSLDRGTKVELKNINSFRAVEEAIKYEIARQEEILREGGKIFQETRGWDEKKGATESQRSKESAHDYRYFPEPDLPPLDLTVFDFEEIKRHLPELPETKRHRFVQEFGLSWDRVEMLVDQKEVADYFEAAASELRQLSVVSYQLLFNYLMSDLRGLMNDRGVTIAELKISPEELAHLVWLIESGKLSSRIAKDLLLKMFETGEDPETLIASSGVKLITDERELEGIVKEIIAMNPQAVADYKKGKGSAIQFLIGQAMAKTKGQAGPEKLRQLFTKELS